MRRARLIHYRCAIVGLVVCTNACVALAPENETETVKALPERSLAVPLVYVEYDAEASAELVELVDDPKVTDDDALAKLELIARLHRSLAGAGAHTVIYDVVPVAPTRVQTLLAYGLPLTNDPWMQSRNQRMAAVTAALAGSNTHAVFAVANFPPWYIDLYADLYQANYYYGHAYVTSERDARHELRLDTCRRQQLQRGMPDPLWPASGIVMPFGDTSDGPLTDYLTHDSLAMAGLAAFRAAGEPTTEEAWETARTAANCLAESTFENVTPTCPQGYFAGEQVNCSDPADIERIVDLYTTGCQLEDRRSPGLVVREEDTFQVPTISAAVLLRAEAARQDEAVSPADQASINTLRGSLAIVGTRAGDSRTHFEGGGQVPGSWVVAWLIEKLASQGEACVPELP